MSLIDTLKDPELKDVIAAAGAAVLGWLAKKAGNWLHHKAATEQAAKKKTAEDTLYERYTGVFDMAVDYAEEKARQYLQEHKRKMESKVKHSVAYSYVVGQLRRLGLPTLAHEAVDEGVTIAVNRARGGDDETAQFRDMLAQMLSRYVNPAASVADADVVEDPDDEPRAA